MFGKNLLRFLGYFGLGLAGLLLVAGTAVFAISQRHLRQHFEVQARAVTVPTEPASIERGRHIVATRSCSECHGADFGGHTVIDSPAIGLFNAPNLTRGAGGLASDFSDLDWVRAIRHGVTRDGRGLVLMPSEDYATITNEDLGAMIAYLKTLAPVARARGPIKPGPVGRALIAFGQIRLAAEKIDHTAEPEASIEIGVSPAYGKYIAATCVGCHGPNFSGGKIAGGPPDWPPAANLTRHASGRLASWTEAQFIQTVRTRVRPDGTKLSTVMPAAFASMNNTELKAIWAYLQTLPPVPTGVR